VLAEGSCWLREMAEDGSATEALDKLLTEEGVPPVAGGGDEVSGDSQKLKNYADLMKKVRRLALLAARPSLACLLRHLAALAVSLAVPLAVPLAVSLAVLLHADRMGKVRLASLAVALADRMGKVRGQSLSEPPCQVNRGFPRLLAMGVAGMLGIERGRGGGQDVARVVRTRGCAGGAVLLELLWLLCPPKHSGQRDEGKGQRAEG
jgi:hypothetical protein